MNTYLPLPSQFVQNSVEKDNPPEDIPSPLAWRITEDERGGEILMSLPDHNIWKDPQAVKLSILLRRRKESSYWKS